MKKEEVLTRSIELIKGDREADYGDAWTNFSDIAALWSVVLSMQVAPWQVAACMSQLKLARAIKTPDHEDSWADMAGYVGLGAELATEPIVQVASESTRFRVGDFIETLEDYEDLPIGSQLRHASDSPSWWWTKGGGGWICNIRKVTWTTDSLHRNCARRRIHSLPGVANG